MKPTQEQVLAWAREVSGVEFPAGTVGVKIGMSPEHLESVAALAYEAGRKDENEACEQHLRDFSQTRMVPVLDTWRMGLVAGANAIRARREQ
jgi:hypothetical protein